MTEPQRPEDPPKEVISHKRRPAWALELIQDAKKYGAPDGSLKESKRPRTYSIHIPVRWHCYPISLMQDLPVTKKQLKKKYGRT